MATPTKHPYFVNLTIEEVAEVRVYRLVQNGTAKKNNPPRPVLLDDDWNAATFRGALTVRKRWGGGSYQFHACDADGRVIANVGDKIDGPPREPKDPNVLGAAIETASGYITIPGAGPRTNLAFAAQQQIATYYKSSHEKLEAGVLALLEKFATQATPQDVMQYHQQMLGRLATTVERLEKQLEKERDRRVDLETTAEKKKHSVMGKLVDKIGDELPASVRVITEKLGDLLEEGQETMRALRATAQGTPEQ